MKTVQLIGVCGDDMGDAMPVARGALIRGVRYQILDARPPSVCSERSHPAL